MSGLRAGRGLGRHFPLLVAGQYQSNHRNQGRQGQVVANILEPVVSGQPGGNVRSQGGTHNTAQVEGHGRARIAHGRRKHFGQQGADGAIGHPHQGQANTEKDGHFPSTAGAEHGRQHQSEQANGDRHRNHGATASKAVGPKGGNGNGQAEEQNRDQLQAQKLRPGITQGRGAPAQGENRHQVKQHKSRQAGEGAQQQRPAMVPEQACDGQFHPLVFLQHFLEFGGFCDLQPHVQAQQHQYGADDEGNPPAVAEKVFRSQGGTQNQEGASGQQKAQGCSQLGEHAIPGPFAGRGIFCRQQYGAAPLTAQAQTLAEAAQGQQQRRQGANGFVGGQQADQHRGNAHGQQGCNQGGLTSNAVTKVAKQGRADRAGKEGNGKGRQGLQHGRRG